MRFLAVVFVVGIGFGTHHAIRSAKAFHHGAAGAGLLLLDEPKPAADHFERALALNDRPTSYTYFGVKAFQRAGRPDNALDAVSVLVERYPDEARYFKWRANVYWNRMVRERMSAMIDKRALNAEKMKLWDQLRTRDLRKAAARGAEFKKPKKIPRDQIDPALLGRWQVIERNGRQMKGDTYEFRPGAYILTRPDGQYMRIEFTLDKTTKPRHYTVRNKMIGGWTHYSYRVDGDVLWLASKGRLMDPPRHFDFGGPIMLDGSRGFFMGTVWKLRRLRDD